jgi:hypothetical protein
VFLQLIIIVLIFIVFRAKKSKTFIVGIFNKLFGKNEVKTDKVPDNKTQTTQLHEGDIFVSAGDNLGYKLVKILTHEQKERINQSTIPVMVGAQLYMHYWTENLICDDPNDYTWQSTVVFFWKAHEPFPKKSLPPIFQTFKEKNFVLIARKPNIMIKGGPVTPWFGMPGYGQRYFFEIQGQKLSIPEVNKLGMLEYIEDVELTSENWDILTDAKNYFFG